MNLFSESVKKIELEGHDDPVLLEYRTSSAILSRLAFGLGEEVKN